MVQNYEWYKVFMNNGKFFFVKSFNWEEKIRNQVGQYGIRFFSHTDKMYYTVKREDADKIILREMNNFGFNPNFISDYTIIKDKEVEVQ